MTILDTILGFFGIRRILLDKPLSLLGQYYYKVLDKVYASAYGIQEDIDWGVAYYSYKEEDPNVIVCQWESIKIMHTIKHDESDRIVAAGRIYIDRDKAFLEDIIRKVTSGRRRVYGKVDYRHFGMYDESEEEYYHYNDDMYILVYRDSDAYDYGHSVTIEYVLRDSVRKKGRRKSPSPRSLGEDRRRIIDDLENNF